MWMVVQQHVKEYEERKEWKTWKKQRNGYKIINEEQFEGSPPMSDEESETRKEDSMKAALAASKLVTVADLWQVEILNLLQKMRLRISLQLLELLLIASLMRGR